jgi:hypothetical protein
MAQTDRASVKELFISEAIRPDVGTLDTRTMAPGEPGLPTVFYWKDQTIRIARVLRTWRGTGPCHHGSGEIYVRKHWFEVETDTGQIMKLYFERQARTKSKKQRWWLFTIQEPDAPGGGTGDAQ